MGRNRTVIVHRPPGKTRPGKQAELTAPVLPEPKNLSNEQRVALYGPGPGDHEVRATLSDAASGVGAIALQYIAATLKGEPRYQMTVQDRMALEMAPRLSAEVKRKSEGDQAAQPGTDPIKELLAGPTGAQEETVRMSTAK